MKIAFFAGHIYPKENGGGAVFQEEVIKELLKYNFESEIVIYYYCDKNIYSDTNKIKFVNLKFEKALNPKKILFFKSKKHIKDFDYILMRDRVDFVYFIVAEPENLKHTPYILTIWDLAHKNHTYFPEVSSNGMFEAREKYYQNSISKASFVVIGNEVGKKEVCNFYNIPNHRVKTIPMPTPGYVYSEHADDSILDKYNLRNEKYLFYPAQFWAHKNHIRLLKAMCTLKDKGFKMVFTGSNKGNGKYINEKIKELHLENYVKCLGFVTENEIIALYQNAYALTYASWFGPDNIPPLEAMAIGCPVVCSNYLGAQEQFKDSALYFDLCNEKTLVENIDKLENNDLRKNLIEKGKILAKNCHVENYVKNMIEIIDEFCLIRECWGENG